MLNSFGSGCNHMTFLGQSNRSCCEEPLLPLHPIVVLDQVLQLLVVAKVASNAHILFSLKNQKLHCDEIRITKIWADFLSVNISLLNSLHFLILYQRSLMHIAVTLAKLVQEYGIHHSLQNHQSFVWWKP